MTDKEKADFISKAYTEMFNEPPQYNYHNFDSLFLEQVYERFVYNYDRWLVGLWRPGD